MFDHFGKWQRSPAMTAAAAAAAGPAKQGPGSTAAGPPPGQSRLAGSGGPVAEAVGFKEPAADEAGSSGSQAAAQPTSRFAFNKVRLAMGVVGGW
jgi:hypothetical protein